MPLERDSDIALSRFRRESEPVKRYNVECLNECHMKADRSKGFQGLLDCLDEMCGDDWVDGGNGDAFYC